MSESHSGFLLIFNFGKVTIVAVHSVNERQSERSDRGRKNGWASAAVVQADLR